MLQKIMKQHETSSLSNVQRDLEALIFGESSEDFQRIENALGAFCPFEAIGMVGQEIRHAHYLAYLLQPQNHHGMGERPLRAFLEVVGDVTGAFSRLDIYTMDFPNVSVRREWNNIDLVIEISPPKSREKGWVIAIELKIDANESEGQLKRYGEYINKQYVADSSTQWVISYLFLTPDGDAPSEGNQNDWVPVGFSPVLEALERCLLDTSGVPTNSNATLRSYINMFRRHHLENPELEELARKLWLKHPEALAYLAERRTDPVSDFRSYLRDEMPNIMRRLSEVVGLPTLSYVEKSPVGNIRFSVDDWLKIPGLASGAGWTSNNCVLAFEINLTRVGDLRLQSLIGPGDQATRERFHQKAIEQDGFNRWRLGGSYHQLAKWNLVTNLEKLIEEMETEDLIERISKALERALLSSTGISAHEAIIDAAGLRESATDPSPKPAP